MWSKLSNVLKARPGTPGLGPEEDETVEGTTDVLGSVFEQHPNLSVFHQPSEVPFPSPSPPASPSKHGRRGMFKRMSKAVVPHNDSTDTLPKIGLPKKVKSSLHSISTGSQHSLGHAPGDAFTRQSQDTARPSIDSTASLSLIPSTPISENKFGSMEDGRFGSLRSILKPGSTPGASKNVRFFSRDAYRVMSPDQSSAEIEEPSLFNRLQRAAPSRPTAQQLFLTPPPLPAKDGELSTPINAQPATSTPMMTPMMIPPPNLGNIFEFSENGISDLPTIIPSTRAPILDSAVEVFETETETETEREEQGQHSKTEDSLPIPETLGTPFGDVLSESSPMRPPPGLHDRSHSFSFGQTVFHSLKSHENASPAKSEPIISNRSRALSDTVFTSMLQSPPTGLTNLKRPEADINDTSEAIVAYQPPEKDPFAANAVTYYTPGTMLPPSPPQATHTRTASREEDLIWSLRTQLALQSELCAQYEVDLAARDELVDTLNTRLSDTEKECDRRKNVVRNWRKRVAELEKCVKGLEEEVDRSRGESFDRSIMDEASGEAMRILHRRINDLERERKDGEQREKEIGRQLESKNEELKQVIDELNTRYQSERELKAGITAAKEEMEIMGQQGGQEELKSIMAKNAEERERHHTIESTWEREREALLATNHSLRDEQFESQSQITGLREEIVRREDELAVLKSELEAQWKHTEETGEELEQLRREKEELSAEVDVLRTQLSETEAEWDDIENGKVELQNKMQEVWASNESLEQEKAALAKNLRDEQDHAEELTRALQEREDRVAALEQQRQHAYDNVSRLQENMRQRDTELAEYSRRFREREVEVDEIRESLTRQKRDHSRIVDEQSRKLSEVVAREVESRANMESVIREKAESDVLLNTLKERSTVLKEEVERLRRQIHELQQESADKEVKLAQAAKQRAQDKEDLQGLNIALDSKQQELELLKRRVGTRPSVGATPAPAAKIPFRRESSIFGTPSVTRPPSSLSDTGSTAKERKLSDPPSVAARLRVRANGSAAHSTKKTIDGSMGPPPLKARSSLAPTSLATPSRIPSTSSLARSSSATPLAKPARHRVSTSLESLRAKGSSTSMLSASDVSEQSEKENVSVTPAARRRMSIAVPA